jgi:nucleotide-binding universal stress UspA family protein
MPVNTKPHPIRRIVVGVDGSEPSAAALAWAIEMARGMHAEIVAVFGLDVPVDLSLGFAPISAAMYQPEWRATLKRMLEDEWTAPLKESGLPQRVLLEDGRPASVIIHGADAVDADIVVVGQRGKGGSRRAAAGQREPRGGIALQASGAADLLIRLR